MLHLSLINSVSHSALGCVLGSALGYVVLFLRSAGLSGKPNTTLPNQSLNAAFGWAAHCMDRPLARRYNSESFINFKIPLSLLVFLFSALGRAITSMYQKAANELTVFSIKIGFFDE